VIQPGLFSCPVTTRPRGIPPASWSWVALSDVARLESGHTPSRRVEAYWQGGNVAWLSLKDIRGLSGKYVTETVDHPTLLGIENSSARVLPRGTVALCRTASVGGVTILGRDMATSQDFVNWVCGPPLVPEYLYWAFKSSEATFAIEKQGSTHQTIYMPVVARFHVLLPPLEEQRRIAEVLDRVDVLRAKRRVALTQLDTLTQAIFLDMLGDPATNAKGWPVSRVGEVADVQGGLQVTSARKKYPREAPYLRVANVFRGFLDLSEIKMIHATDAEIARTTLLKGDLLIVEGHGNPAEIGRGALWDGSIAGCVHQNHIIRARFEAEKIVPLYACQYLNSAGGRRHLLRAGKTTSGLNTISVSEVRATPLALPPISLQREFDRRVVAVEKLKAIHRASLAELDALFASLQHRAFRGEL
jgi:type I restriction enzyme S subunit